MLGLCQPVEPGHRNAGGSHPHVCCLHHWFFLACGCPSGTGMSEVWRLPAKFFGEKHERGRGALFFHAGLTSLVPMSYITHVTMQRFWGAEFPTKVPWWEYDNAMFSDWIGGFFLLTRELVLIMSQHYANTWLKNQPHFLENWTFQEKCLLFTC